jgi:hypothetical protein
MMASVTKILRRSCGEKMSGSPSAPVPRPHTGGAISSRPPGANSDAQARLPATRMVASVGRVGRAGSSVGHAHPRHTRSEEGARMITNAKIAMVSCVV